MPCWVVPAVAAEFWGVSVEQVLADIAVGRLVTQNEGGLVFVAVGPMAESDHAEPGHAEPRPASRRSLAWALPGAQSSVVSAAERDALLRMDDDAVSAAAASETATEPSPEPDTSIDLPASVHDEGEPVPLEDGPDEIAVVVTLLDEPPQWESVRSRVSRSRRPPPRAREAA
jgi:hypothetical protein